MELSLHLLRPATPGRRNLVGVQLKVREQRDLANKKIVARAVRGVCLFIVVSILISVEQYLIILTCISLIAKMVGIFLRAYLMSEYFVKVSCESLAQFLKDSLENCPLLLREEFSSVQFSHSVVSNSL